MDTDALHAQLTQLQRTLDASPLSHEDLLAVTQLLDGVLTSQAKIPKEEALRAEELLKKIENRSAECFNESLEQARKLLPALHHRYSPEIGVLDVGPPRLKPSQPWRRRIAAG